MRDPPCKYSQTMGFETTHILKIQVKSRNKTSWLVSAGPSALHPQQENDQFLTSERDEGTREAGSVSLGGSLGGNAEASSNLVASGM